MGHLIAGVRHLRYINVKQLLLSSNITFCFKYLLCPVLLVSLPILCSLNLYLSLLESSFEIEMLFAPIIILVVFGLMLIPFLQIKKVVLLPDGFLVSNYRLTWFISFDKVKSVHGSLLLSPELIWLRVEDGDYGRFIIFIPKCRLKPLPGFTINPVVKELRAFIKN